MLERTTNHENGEPMENRSARGVHPGSGKQALVGSGESET